MEGSVIKMMWLVVVSMVLIPSSSCTISPPNQSDQDQLAHLLSQSLSPSGLFKWVPPTPPHPNVMSIMRESPLTRILTSSQTSTSSTETPFNPVMDDASTNNLWVRDASGLLHESPFNTASLNPFPSSSSSRWKKSVRTRVRIPSRGGSTGWNRKGSLPSSSSSSSSSSSPSSSSQGFPSGPSHTEGMSNRPIIPGSGSGASSPPVMRHPMYRSNRTASTMDSPPVTPTTSGLDQNSPSPHGPTSPSTSFFSSQGLSSQPESMVPLSIPSSSTSHRDRWIPSRQTRESRLFDVPQIDCPPGESGTDRFSCPTPDSMGRYRCIDDHSLCDGFIDCPKGEDEDRTSCMFYKTTKAHMDVLVDVLLRMTRRRF